MKARTTRDIVIPKGTTFLIGSKLESFSDGHVDMYVDIVDFEGETANSGYIAVKLDGLLEVLPQ